MLTLLRRQSRRLLVCAALVATAFAVKMTQYLQMLPDAPDGFAPYMWIAAPLLAALIGAGIALISTSAIILVFPAQRGCAELIAILLFLGLVLFPLVPPSDTEDSALSLTLGLIFPLLWIVAALALNAVLVGTALDRTQARLDLRSVHRFQLPIPPEDAWRRLVPGAATPEDHWDPLLHRIEPDPEKPKTYAVEYAHGTSLFEHQTMTFLELDEAKRAAYHHIGEGSPANRALTEGVYEIDIAPAPDGGSEITLRSRLMSLLPRIALAMWLDNTLADSADFLRAKLTGKRDWSMAGRYRRDVQRVA